MLDLANFNTLAMWWYNLTTPRWQGLLRGVKSRSATNTLVWQDHCMDWLVTDCCTLQGTEGVGVLLVIHAAYRHRAMTVQWHNMAQVSLTSVHSCTSGWTHLWYHKEQVPLELSGQHQQTTCLMWLNLLDLCDKLLVLRDLTYLTYATSLPVDHSPQTTRLHPAPSWATASIFLQLYLKPTVHIYFSRYLFKLLQWPWLWPSDLKTGPWVLYNLTMSTVVLAWQHCHHSFSECVQANSIFFFLEIQHCESTSDWQINQSCQAILRSSKSIWSLTCMLYKFW